VKEDIVKMFLVDIECEAEDRMQWQVVDEYLGTMSLNHQSICKLEDSWFDF
jgi:hypothetical protein